MSLNVYASLCLLLFTILVFKVGEIKKELAAIKLMLAIINMGYKLSESSFDKWIEEHNHERI